MAQVQITTTELDSFRRIYAEAMGEEIEIAEGVYALDEGDVTATDLTLADFVAKHPHDRLMIEGHDAAMFSGHKGRNVVVAQFTGKTLAAGPGIKR